MRSRFLSLVVAGLMSVPALAETGSLKMQFVYGGTPPKAEEITPNKDAEFCGKQQIVNEKLLVSEKGGIKNVVVYVYTGRGGSKLKDIPASKGATHVLDNKGCRFEPRYVVAQKGDTLSVTNSDDVGHNANMQFLKNSPANPNVPPKGKHDVKLESEEPAPIPVDCNIHPWMRAYVIVQEHPYVAVSDADGNLEIKDLPTGDLTFRVFHEAVDGVLKEVKVDGKAVEWKANRFEVKIKGGANDMGKVELGKGNFK